MPLDIRKNDTLGAGAPLHLVSTIRAAYDQLRDVRVEVRKGRTYETTLLAIGIQKLDALAEAGIDVDDNMHDETPEEIAAAVFELAADHAMGTGSGFYRANCYGDTPKGDYGKLSMVVFSIGIDGVDGSVHGGTAGSDTTDVLELAKNIAADVHTRHMTTLDKTNVLAEKVVEMAGKLSEAAGPLATAMVDVERIKFDRFDREMDSEDRRAWISGGYDFLSKVAEPFGLRLADVIADKWKDVGVSGDETISQTSSYARRLAECLSGLSSDQVAALSDLLGPDLYSLLETMKGADTDEEFSNVAKEFITRGRSLKDWTGKLGDVGKIIGPERFAKLGGLLGEI